MSFLVSQEERRNVGLNPIQVVLAWRGGGGGGEVTPILFLHISFSWVEIRMHTEFQLSMLLRSGSFMVGETTKKQEKFQ
jgi:hypothetical protein